MQAQLYDAVCISGQPSLLFLLLQEDLGSTLHPNMILPPDLAEPCRMHVQFPKTPLQQNDVTLMLLPLSSHRRG